MDDSGFDYQCPYTVESFTDIDYQELPSKQVLRIVRDMSSQHEFASLRWRGCTVTYRNGELFSVTCQSLNPEPSTVTTYSIVKDPTEESILQLFRWTYKRNLFTTPFVLIHEKGSRFEFTDIISWPPHK